MQHLNTRYQYKKPPPSKDAKNIYLFCEGDKDEVKYFDYFSQRLSKLKIIPIPSENGKTDPIKLKLSAEIKFGLNSQENVEYQLSESYEDEVWFVIDTDKWNEGDKINKLKDFVKKQNSNYKGWFIAQSNPSFEIWKYYHHYSEKPLATEVYSSKSFKDFLNSKITGGFNNKTHPILLADAIKNSELNIKYNDLNQPDLYSTELHTLGKTILKFLDQK